MTEKRKIFATSQASQAFKGHSGGEREGLGSSGHAACRQPSSEDTGFVGFELLEWGPGVAGRVASSCQQEVTSA